ncbi:MAG: ATP-dependent helicase [Clostridiales bacterium]|nr:ATP-dependent helicase [Clostridiales bacterium]
MPEQNINKAQALAIEHASGPMQVLAGPGSGKTYLTIRRVRHLIRHHGVSPDKILVITFTKVAAEEMKERFLKLTEHTYPEVHFGTFHAIYFHILKQSGYSNLKLASLTDKRNYLRHILRVLGIEEEINTEFYGKLLKAISTVKSFSSADKISISMRNNYEEQIEKQFPFIYEEYCRIMEEESKIDFDDMILLCDKLFESNPTVLSFWQKAFTHILVDEFQDISPLQYRILRRLAFPQNNIFVVGDDDQAIYGFRSAAPDIMKQFMDDYAQAKQIMLGTNYRCAGEIVKASGIVIADNRKRFDKKLTANKKESGVVKITSCTTKEEEHRYLLECLKKMTIEELSQCAVIYRTNAEAGTFSRELVAWNIPFCIKERIDNIFETPVSQDILSYLNFARELFENNNNEGNGGHRSDFLRIMNKPSRYIQRQAVSSPTVTQKLLMDYYREKPFMQETVRNLWADLKRLSSLRPYLAIDYIRRNMGYEEYLCRGQDKEKREIIKELLDEIQQTASNCRTFKAWKEYAQEYTELLHKKEETAKCGQEGIHLLTMHLSKGLEYKNVYLPDIRKGVMPHRKAVLPEEVEEERRLLYVAMTRAKDFLEILHYGEPSPFIIKLKEVFDNKA